MKKQLILSGPDNSGKTWISEGITNFFDNTRWVVYRGCRVSANMYPIQDIDLILVDELYDLSDIKTWETTMKDYPEINFIFCTQSNIELTEKEKEIYHLVKLSLYSQ